MKVPSRLPTGEARDGERSVNVARFGRHGHSIVPPERVVDVPGGRVFSRARSTRALSVRFVQEGDALLDRRDRPRAVDGARPAPASVTFSEAGSTPDAEKRHFFGSGPPDAGGGAAGAGPASFSAAIRWRTTSYGLFLAGACRR